MFFAPSTLWRRYPGETTFLSAAKKSPARRQKRAGGRSLFHGTLLISTDLEAMSEALKPDETKLIGHGVKSVRSRVANLSEYTKEVSPDIIGAMLTDI